MTAEEKSKTKVTIQPVDDKIPAPDGGYGWVVLTASFMISFIIDGVMYSFGVILPSIRDHYNVKDEVGNIMSSFNTGFLFCSGPIVAGLSNQFGCRAVVMGGGVVTSFMFLLTAFSPTFYGCIIFYGFIGGLSTGCTYIASLIIIADYFDKKRGIATGITMAGSGVGSFVFAPLIGLLIKKFDWKFTMCVCACIILQTVVCGALLKPLNPSGSAKQVELKNLNSKGAQQKAEAHNAGDLVIQTHMGSICSINMVGKEEKFYQRSKFLKIVIGILKEMTDFKLLIQNLGFLLITLSNFFAFTGYFTPFLYLTEMSKQSFTQQNYPHEWLLSIIGIVNIPCRMLYGFIADRRIISAINLNTFAVLAITASLFLIQLFTQHFYLMVMFAVVFAIGAAGMNSLTTMYLCDLVGLKKFGNATGIINLFRGFGCFLGPILGGQVKDKFGMVYTFYFSGICFIVCVALAFVVSFKSLLCPNKEEPEIEIEKPDGSDNKLLNQNA